MQASTVGTPTVGHCGTIFVAIELSQKTWQVGRRVPNRHVLRACPAQAVSRSKSAHTGTWSDGFSQAHT
jgi:hypothetical protein